MTINWRFMADRIVGHSVEAGHITFMLCGFASLIGLVQHGFPEVYTSLDIARGSGINVWDWWWQELGGNPTWHMVAVNVALLKPTMARIIDYTDYLAVGDEEEQKQRDENPWIRLAMQVVILFFAAAYSSLVASMLVFWVLALALLDLGIALGHHLRQRWSARHHAQAA